MIPAQFVTQIVTIPFDQGHTLTLRSGIPIKNIHVIFLRIVLGRVTADKNRSAGDQHSLHKEPPLFFHYSFTLGGNQGIYPCISFFAVL